MKNIVRTKVWCNNTECKFCHKLDKPKTFSFNKMNYVPLEDNNIIGQCTKEGYDLFNIMADKGQVQYRFAVCNLSETEAIICDVVDCLHNNKDGVCTRTEIWINKSPAFPDKGYWHCRCFSNSFISGHRDWSSLLQPNKTAKGGHIDDSYAKKMHEDSKKFKSFEKWHKDSK